MKRRTVVKGIILFSLGTGILYSCTDKYKAIRDLNLDYFKPEDAELDIVDSLSNIIVPLHKIEGMESHTALPFIFTMIDDVHKKEDRAIFLAGYKNFDVYVEEFTGKKFSRMNEEEQQAFVSSLNDRDEKLDGDIIAFFDLVKGESIKYLKTSEMYQRKINYYEMAPGRFKGSVLIDELKNRNEV